MYRCFGVAFTGDASGGVRDGGTDAWLEIGADSFRQRRGRYLSGQFGLKTHTHTHVKILHTAHTRHRSYRNMCVCVCAYGWGLP